MLPRGVLVSRLQYTTSSPAISEYAAAAASRKKQLSRSNLASFASSHESNEGSTLQYVNTTRLVGPVSPDCRNSLSVFHYAKLCAPAWKYVSGQTF